MHVADLWFVLVCDSDGEQRRQLPHKTDWPLENPPARPHIDAPPTIVPHAPVRHVTTVTRVMVPSGGGCQHGSKLCIVL